MVRRIQKSRHSPHWVICAHTLRQQGSSQIRNSSKVGNSEAVRLLSIIEKSQVPFGQSADVYNRLKTKVEANEQLTMEEHEQLKQLVKLARDWEKGVESSAMTEPEETLAG